ncbi:MULTISPECIES: DUF4405 domain-containing protein [Prosthecochloris]|uniref:DUF4405 domain-containing protein n=1 Tax=Prosthecochloris vibrioformis TaxID=1098 RepID=A0A5C4S0D2_PROVB|nr:MULTISPECIES: DUF4405 domain-containing protein [Prosthecochloris]ANT64225.1 hypothetical protein Ptc2401_00426 [Prosthecochloris sp. CIB 2401]TNJ36649.1 DUF4405 domain-containing protein [Prosthecochloris vibrioformis]
MTTPKKTFSWRAFISLGLVPSFLVLVVSGIILYLAPAGRVANWTDWQLLGLTKTEWQEQHTIFSLLFAILSIFHLLSINWKAFWSYIVSKTRKGLSKPIELSLIIILSLVTGIGTYKGVPPFSTINNFGETLTDSWETTEGQAPIPHTERFTLSETAARFTPGKSPQELRKILENNGLSVESVDQTLENIAEQNGTSAKNVFDMLGIEATASGKGQGSGQGRRNR